MVPETVAELFRSTYGSDPEVIASAPGRVNLIGEHLDYNGGEVLPMAIASRTWVAMRRNQRSSSRILSSTEDHTGMFESPAPRRSGGWWDYVSGLGSLPGKTLPAVDITVASDVPSRAGLSSSAALEVASGCAYAALGDSPVSLRDVALDGWRVETQFVGVASGIMDQFASALSLPGHALHIWCDRAETEAVPFARTVLIFDTGAERSLRNSDFNLRRSECAEAFELLRARNPGLESLACATRDEVDAASLPDPLAQRAWHVVTEMERVHAAVQQLRVSGTIDSHLLYESHQSLRDQYQCSSPELDWFVDRAGRADGVEGARLTGAGWGGCAIAFGSRDALEAAGQEIAKEYETAFNLEPRFWLSDASQGARIELR